MDESMKDKLRKIQKLEETTAAKQTAEFDSKMDRLSKKEKDLQADLNEDQSIRINELEAHEQETFEDFLAAEMMEMKVE